MNKHTQHLFSLTTSCNAVLQTGFSEKTNLSRETADLNKNVYKTLVSLGDSFYFIFWYLLLIFILSCLCPFFFHLIPALEIISPGNE